MRSTRHKSNSRHLNGAATLSIESLESRALLSVNPILDIRSGTDGANIKYLATIGGNLYFSADDGVHGVELWKSDGTAAGTGLVKDIFPGATGSSPGFVTISSTTLSSAAVLNDVLYFAANDGVNGAELWRSDGTESGTYLVKNIRAGATGSLPSEITVVNGQLLFAAEGTSALGGNRELWRSDGTAEGTALVVDMNPIGSHNPRNLVEFNGALYYQGAIFIGQGLFRSDGTAGGTQAIVTGGGSTGLGSDVEPTNVGSGLLFAFNGGEGSGADGGEGGTELYGSDGIVGGTTALIKDINPTGSSTPAEFTNLNGIVLFSADDGSHGRELWTTDGTEAGTVLFKDIATGSTNSNPSHLTVKDDTLYFAAANGAHGAELWRSDGTPEGTVLVKDILPGIGDSNPIGFVSTGNLMFFSADDGANGVELWCTDGTPGGTRLYADLSSVAGGSNPLILGKNDRFLFVRASDSATGQELYAIPYGAFAGGPYTIAEGDSLALDANYSTDPENDPLTYSWDVNGDGVYGDASGATPTLTWNELLALGITDGPSTWQVRVGTDDGNGTVNTSLPVPLTVMNAPPTADAGGPYAIAEEDDLTLSGSGTDPNADLLTYSWDLNGDGIFDDASGAAPTLTWAQLVTLGIDHGPSIFNVQLRVSDGDGAETTSLATTLSIGNSPPTANAGGPYSIEEGGDLSLAGSGFDSSPVSSLTYAWDVNGDDVFTDAVGPAPVLFWSELVALGITGGPASFAVKLRVSDGDGGVTTSGATTLDVLNAPPMADAGGAYSVAEGDSLTLSATGTDAGLDTLSFSWDLNGDDDFGDTVGTGPTLSWAQLVALGIDNGPASHLNVRVRVDDGDGAVVTSSATSLTVVNSAPTTSIVGSSTGARDQELTFTFHAMDASNSDQLAGFTFQINWGDESPSETVYGVSGINVAHTYTSIGPHDISVTATDIDGSVSLIATHQVVISAVQTVVEGGLVNLVWTGSNGQDHVTIEQLSPDTIRVTTLQDNGAVTSFVESFSGVSGGVRLSGGGGNDVLDARLLSTIPATLDGGGGNNTLYGGQAGDILIGGSTGSGKQGSNTIIAGDGNNTIYGNAIVGAEGSTGGNNIIVGGTGNDTIYGAYAEVRKPNGSVSNGGEGGQNLIIGGGGNDLIYASQEIDGAEGGKGSILVAGETNLSQAALAAILSEWTSTRDYATRIENILGSGVGLRNNGDHFLQVGVSISNDGAVDELFSDTKGKDNWLLYALAMDAVSRKKPTETVTNLP